MPRIEIELTSSRPDGTWTWRAAGARQPKGIVDGSLLSGTPKVGDVLRADTAMDLEGIHVTAVLPPKTKRPDSDRLALLGPPEPEVTRSPLPAPDSARSPKDRRGTRPPSGDREGRGDRRGPGSRPGPGRGGKREPGAPPAGGRGQRRPRSGDREARGPSGPTERGAQAPRDRRERRPDRAPASRPGPPAPTRAKRLHPGRAHREAVLADLAPEQRPVAEQVLRGGIPAVRQAVEEHNVKARAAGEPEIKADALLAMAEDLLPRLRGAEWRDRAEAAMADAEAVGLRDLRAIVAGSDAGRDEASRDLASRLREVVERRGAAERESWLDEIRRSLDEGRVVRALRVSSRPPEPGLRFPAELAGQLSAAAGGAMAADVAPDRWTAVLDAVVSSPIRLSVRPQGLPPDPGEALTNAIRRAAPRVPALAGLVDAGGRRRPTPPRPSAAIPTPPEAATPLAEAGAPVREPAAAPGGSGDDRDDAVVVEELGQAVDQS